MCHHCHTAASCARGPEPLPAAAAGCAGDLSTRISEEEKGRVSVFPPFSSPSASFCVLHKIQLPSQSHPFPRLDWRLSTSPCCHAPEGSRRAFPSVKHPHQSCTEPPVSSVASQNSERVLSQTPVHGSQSGPHWMSVHGLQIPTRSQWSPWNPSLWPLEPELSPSNKSQLCRNPNGAMPKWHIAQMA